jgi:16S rRNA (guanine527-N7)-methyltransferase
VNDDVSRETPPAPASARGVFAAALPVAEAYAELLATDGVTRGLIGPREAPRLWERHLVNCALLREAIPAETDVCDIGSGAGLPGLVLAIARPDLEVTLVEPLLRRTTFLSEVVEALALANVEVVRARAEELHGLREFSVVTSRAVAPLGRLLDWSMPLVRQDGALLAMKGSSVNDEIAAAEVTLRKHGAGAVTVATYGEGVIDPPTTVVRVEAARPSRLRLSPGGKAAAHRATSAKSRRKGRKK